MLCPIENGSDASAVRSPRPNSEQGPSGGLPTLRQCFYFHEDADRRGRPTSVLSGAQPEVLPGESGRVGSGTEREGADVRPMSQRLHQFFQAGSVMPYALREKTMNDAKLGFVPRDALLNLTQERHRMVRGRPGTSVSVEGRPPRALRRGSQPHPGTGESRYRKIEDLALFVRTGVVTPETRYFLEPMQRREEVESTFIPIQQKVIRCADPRDERNWTDDGKTSRTVANLQAVVPRRAQLCKSKFDVTTGLVKPYAPGKSAHIISNRPFSDLCIENAMESYVMTMQCQRPGKGLRAPLVDE